MDFAYGAIVYKTTSHQREPQYLIILTGDRTFWGLPKGHKEHDETDQETAIREVWEETGQHVELDNNFSHQMIYRLPSGEDKTTTFFLGKSISADPINLPNKEIAEIKWCSFEDAITTLTHDNAKNALKHAHEWMNACWQLNYNH